MTRGPSEVGGLPTTVTLGELEGAAWTEVWFPEPKVKPDEGFGPARVFDKKTVAVRAAGAPRPPAWTPAR